MSRVFQFYRLLNALSVDVVAGAAVSAAFLARLLSIELTIYSLAALCLTVWIIYTVDHLRDAKRIRKPAATYRHQIHQQYFRPISLALAFAVLADMAALWLLPQAVVMWGLVLASAVFLYLLLHQQLLIMKELCIAVLYTGGVALPSVAVSNGDMPLFLLPFLVQFCLLALINLLMFSWFDRSSDQHNEQHSFVTRVGEKNARIVLWSLIAVELCLVAIMPSIFQAPLYPTLVVGVMGLSFWWIFRRRSVLAENDAHRLWGDAVFLVPLCYLFAG